MKRIAALLAPIALLMTALSVEAQTMAESVIKPEEWAAYQEAFLGKDGRIIDTGNGNISHSEGQGYGLLLSYLAQDKAAFERIWSFTQNELMVRDDGLAAWRWETDKSPHVVDVNNASDGDVLIAYALALAGQGWGDAEKTATATRIVKTLGQTTLVEKSGLLLMLPAVTGFSEAERADGPVVNPSYWVYEAYPVFAALTPDIDWARLSGDGLKLLDRTRFGRSGLPSDWVSVGDEARPAAGFPPEFSYNNIRVPLYLMRAGLSGPQLARFSGIGDASGLATMNVTTGAVLGRLEEPGFRLIAATIACTTTATPIPADLQMFTPSSYYAATLQLLLLDHLRRQQPACLKEAQP